MKAPKGAFSKRGLFAKSPFAMFEFFLGVNQTKKKKKRESILTVCKFVSQGRS